MAGKTFYNSDIAVALKYDGQQAPKVTAKGEGITAEQIWKLLKNMEFLCKTNLN